jgi:cell division protein FtsI/penicillin-binding protein 2
VKQEIADWGACVNLLAPAMNKNPDVLQKIYDRSQSAWLMDLGIIEPGVYDAQHTQMETTCAAQFESRPVRQYSNGTAAANIIGTVGYPDERITRMKRKVSTLTRSQKVVLKAWTKPCAASGALADRQPRAMYCAK